MRTTPPAPLRELEIRSEYDVVAMRQEVRQVARGLGLELTQQAKISTAISTIARSLIAANYCATMRMRTDILASRPAIEITCQLSNDHVLTNLGELTQLLHFGEAQALVDEATLSLDSGGVLCCLRMWLHR
jgi:hypothetical protein